VVITGA
jgi:dihydroflavonol-4-reductase